MQRSLARQLLSLLLLLALLAGGDRFAVMPMSMDMDGSQMSDMQKPDVTCKACDGMAAETPCDAVCAALPAIDGNAVTLSDVRAHEEWMPRADSGTTSFIKPDPSPPRA